MIPFQQLNIAPVTQEKLTSNDVAAKMLLAQGRGCTSDEEILAVCMLLSQDDNSSVAALATSTLSGWSGEKILAALGRQTHGKLLEFVVEFLPAHRVVDEYIFQCPNMNERTARLIAQRVDAEGATAISYAMQTFLLYPTTYWSLLHNSQCPRPIVERLEAVLKQQQAFVEEPIGARTTPSMPKLPITNIAIEVMTALQSKPSPALKAALDNQMFLDVQTGSVIQDEGFEFTFDEQDDFTFDAALTTEEPTEEQPTGSLEQIIRDMNVGQRIKLAYKGNKEARGILIRDTNKSVSVAVLKSGRVNAGEAAKYAANRNLSDEVIRTICATKEFMRKKNVQLALVNNPKTPTKVAMSIMMSLGKKDLQALSKNRSVSSNISKAALKRFKELYQR